MASGGTATNVTGFGVGHARDALRLMGPLDVEQTFVSGFGDLGLSIDTDVGLPGQQNVFIAQGGMDS